VRYTLTDTTLEKGVIEPNVDAEYPPGTETVSTILRRVQNNALAVPTFRFYDEHGNEIDPDGGSTLSVKRISTELHVQGIFGGTDVTAALRGSASIRNLKYIY